MAVLKERLNRKNASGGYDTIYLETSSDIVIRPDGATVEATLTTIKNDLTQVQNDLADVGGDIQQQVTTIITGGNAKHASTHASGGSDPITPGAIGALSSGGTAAAATKLATSRTIQTNLGSTSAASFNGTTNVSPGVTGTLGLGNGGTGKTTAPLSLYALINGSSAITGASLADTDVIGVGDVSAATGKKVTIAELKSLFGSSDGGTSGGDGSTSGSTSPGGTMTFDNMSWIVVDNGTRNSNEIVLMMKDIWHLMNGYNIERFCTYFWNYVLSPAAREKCVPHHFNEFGTNAFTIPVFVPTYTEVNGGFSYLNSNSRRIANYNGSPAAWWTSTPYGSSRVYYVKADGSFSNYGNPSGAVGFRPFVALRK